MDAHHNHSRQTMIESSIVLFGGYNCPLVRRIELNSELITFPLDKGHETLHLSLSFKHITRIEFFDNSEHEGAGLVIYVNDFMARKIQECLDPSGALFSEFVCNYTKYNDAQKFIVLDILNGDPNTIMEISSILTEAAIFHRSYVIQQMNKSGNRKRNVQLPVNYIETISSHQWLALMSIMGKTVRYEDVAYGASPSSDGRMAVYRRAVICDLPQISNGGHNGVVLVSSHQQQQQQNVSMEVADANRAQQQQLQQSIMMSQMCHQQLQPTEVMMAATSSAAKSPPKLLPDRLLVNPPSSHVSPFRVGFQTPQTSRTFVHEQHTPDKTTTTTVHQGSKPSALISTNYHPNLCAQSDLEHPAPVIQQKQYLNPVAVIPQQTQLAVYKVSVQQQCQQQPATPLISTNQSAISMNQQPLQFTILQPQTLQQIDVFNTIPPAPSMNSTSSTVPVHASPSNSNTNLPTKNHPQQPRQQLQQQLKHIQQQIQMQSPNSVPETATVGQFLKGPRFLKIQKQLSSNNNNNNNTPITTPITPMQLQLPSTSQDQIPNTPSQKTPRSSGARATKREREVHLIDDETEEPTTPVEKRNNDTLLTFPPTGPEKCSVHFADLKYLSTNFMLNDTIIDFYLKYIQYRLVPPERRNKIFIFNTFFFGRLTQPPRTGKPTSAVTMATKLRRVQSNYQTVKNWTKKINLFDMDYIVVPINEDIHWYLAIIVNVRYGICSHQTKKSIYKDATLPQDASDPKPYLIVLNSLIDPAEDKHLSVREQLAEYLNLEYCDKHGSNKETHFNKFYLNVVVPTMLPQQKGYIDCGLFLLHFAQLFLVNPPKIITKKSSFLRWYPQFEIKNKRHEIRNVIRGLAAHVKQSDFVYTPMPLKKRTRGGRRSSQADKMNKMTSILENMSLMGRTRRYSDSDVDGIVKDEHFSFLYRPRSLDSLVRENREKPIVLQPPTIGEMSRYKRMKSSDIL